MSAPEPAPVPGTVRSIARPLELLQQGSTNDCGVFATAMAARAIGRYDVAPERLRRVMAPFRVPFVGATTPRAVRFALGRLGIAHGGGWFGRIEGLKELVDRGRPVLVIVRPTDFGQLRFFDLHYRVVVGYDDDTAAPGGGWLYLACSALGPADLLGSDRPCSANLRLSYAEFKRQWATWATWRWHLWVGD